MFNYKIPHSSSSALKVRPYFIGDIAFRFLQFVNYQRQKAGQFDKLGHVTVSDINKSMLEVCEQKANQLGYKEGVFCDYCMRLCSSVSLLRNIYITCLFDGQQEFHSSKPMLRVYLVKATRTICTPLLLAYATPPTLIE